MIIFYLITAAVLIALIYVFWLIWKEQDQDAADTQNAKPDKDEHINAAGILDRIGIKPAPPQKKEGLKNFFAHLRKGKSQPEQSLPEPVTANPQVLPETGTASLRLDRKEQQSINTEVELSIKNDELQRSLEELQEKYQKVDQLLKEKNDALEKNQKELDHERKNRKEFNKVKDLLEKELKEANDRTKKVQTDFTAFKAESQTYTNRISQLEEKIKTLEKALNEKNALIKDNEQKINTLNQKIAEAAPAVPDAETISAEQPATPAEETLQPATPNNSENIAAVPTETKAVESAMDNTITEPPPEASPNTKDTEQISVLPKEDVTLSNDATPTKKLDLNPVSNLEPHYDSDAAPQPEKKENPASPTLTEQETPALAEPQETTATPVESSERPSTELTSFAQDQAKAIDDFLNANTRPQPTETTPKEQTAPTTDESPTPTDIQNTVEPSVPAGTTAAADPAEKNNQPPEETKSSVLKPSRHEEIHLAPDIFKDIEAQFRQIEQEMNITENEQNIDTEENPNSKTQDQNSETGNDNPNQNN